MLNLAVNHAARIAPHLGRRDCRLPRRGIVGIDTGVEEDLLRETLLEFALRTLEVNNGLEEGEGLDRGVVQFLRVLEVDLAAGALEVLTEAFAEKEVFFGATTLVGGSFTGAVAFSGAGVSRRLAVVFDF